MNQQKCISPGFSSLPPDLTYCITSRLPMAGYGFAPRVNISQMRTPKLQISVNAHFENFRELNYQGHNLTD